MIGRRRWHLRVAVLVLLWAAAAVVVAIIHPFIPAARWLMVHVLVLGVAANAIVIWSSYFADALLRTRRIGHRREALTLLILNPGIVAVGAGVVTGWYPVLMIGAALIAAAALLHGVGLWFQSRGTLASRFSVTVRYYITAALCLPVGGWLGVEMVRGSQEMFAQLLFAHIGLNVLGFVGLTVAGTLLTFWPTMLRTQIEAGAERAVARAWWLLVLGLLIITGSSALDAPWAVAAGVLVYIAGLAVIGVSLVRAAAARAPSHFAPWSVAFSLGWWVGSLVILTLMLISAESMSDAVGSVRSLTAPFALGFLAQLIAGALSYLLPVVLGGGPGVTRRTTALLDRGRWVRLVVLNGAALLALIPAPPPMQLSLSFLAASALVMFLVLAVRAIIAAVRKETAPRPVDA